VKGELEPGAVYRVRLLSGTYVVLLSLSRSSALVLDSDHPDYRLLLGQEVEWRWFNPNATTRVA